MSTQTTSSGLQPLTLEQSEELAAWRAWALAKMPYFSHLLFAFRPLNAPGLGTFACDKNLRLYIDFDYVLANKSFEWNAESLLHECGHIWGEHMQFAEEWGFDEQARKIWNVAGDLSINDDLTDAGCVTFAEDNMIPSAIGEPDHQTALHYHEVLMKKVQQAQQQQQQQQQQGGNQQGQGGQQQQQQSGAQGQNGQGQGQQQPGQGGAQQGQQGPGQQQPGQNGQGGTPGQQQQGGQGGGSTPGLPFKGCGSISGGQPAPCELPSDDDANGHAPAANSGEIETVMAATAGAIIEQASRGRGTVPAGMLEKARGFLSPPKVPWQRVLSAHVRRAVRIKAGEDVADHSRRDRRRHGVRVGGKKVVYPGRARPVISLAVVRDTSGSMGAAEIDRATSEIVGIAKAMHIKGDDLKILDVDAKVHTTKGFTNAAALNAVAGRGGTDMTVGIREAMELRPRPAAIVVLTDGGTPWPAERTRIPFIACLIGPYAEQARSYVPSWVQTIVIEPDED